MIHANRIVTVGEQECIIDRPIVLYRGDREVEIEFTLVGNEFMFSEEGNVIKSVNASHGQLVLNTPSGEHMFSELAECHEGKVVFVVTKEMIDEFIEIGFYSFQIRLYDSAEMKSRVTIPPVMNGFDIRNPIAAEDETNVVDQGIVDYARIFKDQSNEELPTFTWDGEYVKTEWAHHDVITENKMNKIEDALYSINANIKESDVVMLNALDTVKKDADAYVKEHMAEVEADVEEFERNLNTDVQKFKVDTNAAMTSHKNEVSEELDGFSTQLAHIATKSYIDVTDFGVILNDENIDNSQAIKNAFVYAFENKKNVYFPSGVCVSDQCYIPIPSNNGNIKIFGDGMTSIIRRKNGVVTARHQPLFWLYMDETDGNFESLEICDLKFDGNSTGNPGENYDYELCASLRICGNTENAQINRLTIDNVEFYDSVADGVWIAKTEQNSFIKNIILSRIYTFERSRTRSDICVTGSTPYVSISDCHIKSLEYEYDWESDTQSELIISNVYTNNIDIGGVKDTLVNVNIVNLIATGWCHFGALSGEITNSKLHLKGDTFPWCKGLKFNNCNILISVDESEKNIYPFGFSFYRDTLSDGTKVDRYVDLEFNSCKFILNTKLNEIFNGYIYSVDFKHSLKNSVTFKNCEFDKRAQGNLNLSRCGKVKLINNIYSANNGGRAIQYTSIGYKTPDNTDNGFDHCTNLLIESGNFDNVGTDSTFLYIVENSYGVLETKNLIVEESKVKTHGIGIVGYGKPQTFISDTTILLDESLEGRKIPGIAGDKYRLKKPIDGGAFEWVALYTNYNGCINKVISTVGL